MFSRFNPITGEGSVGERVFVHIQDFPMQSQWLPTSMVGNPLVKALIKNNGIDGFLRNDMGVEEPTQEDREAVIISFVRLRSLHDFPFWAATFVYIKNKEVGQPDCLFPFVIPST